MIPRPDVLIGNLTHVGMERSVNQDYYGYFEPENEAEFQALGRLVVVCDGMGGHAGGEVASRLAVNTIIERYRQDRSGNLLEAMRIAIETANRTVWEEGQAKAELKGMGTTVVAIALRQGIAYVAHVGDSRCYLIRNNQLHQVTLDHSLVQQMVNEGLLTEEEMESHPEKNVILRSLGVKPDVDVEVQYQPYQVDDIFMLSSDGLTGLVSKEECFQIAMMHRDQPMQACAQLIDLANRYGGYDNITVQIARVVAMSPHEGMARYGGQAPQAQAPSLAPPPEAKAAPSAHEMSQNANAAPGTGKSTTGVMTPEEVEKIKREALAQAKAEAEAAVAKHAPKAAPAKAGGTAKQGGPVLAAPVAAGVAGGTLVLGLALGLVFGGGSKDSLDVAREALVAVSSKPHTEKAAELTEHAQKLAEALRDGDVDGAKRALASIRELPAGQPAPKVREESLEALAERVARAQSEARGLGADAPAGPEWQRGQALFADAQQKRAAKDAGGAIEAYLESLEQFQAAGTAAADAAARKELERLEGRLSQLRTEAGNVRAVEHIGELVQQAETEAESAKRLRPTDPQRAVLSLKGAVGLLESAVKNAPVIEKKKLTKARDAIAKAKASADALKAKATAGADAVYRLADEANARAEGLAQQGKIPESILAFGEATELYGKAAALVASVTVMQGALDAKAAAAGARTKAAALGATSSELAAGDAALLKGAKAAEAPRWDEARAAFEEARKSFEGLVAAAEQRKQQLAGGAESARNAAKAARQAAEKAGAKVGAGAASFGKGVEAERLGDTQLVASRFAEAKQQYEQAKGHFEQAVTAASQKPVAQVSPERQAAEKARQEMVSAKAALTKVKTPTQHYVQAGQKCEDLAVRSFERGSTTGESQAFKTARDYFEKARAYYLKAAGN